MEKLYAVFYKIHENLDYKFFFEYLGMLGEWIEPCAGIRFVKSNGLDVERVGNDLKGFAKSGKDVFIITRVYEDEMCAFMPSRNMIWIKKVRIN